MLSPSIEDYRVELDAYAGPLDLLLFLVKRHEIDLNDIPVAKLTEQYLEHLKLIQQIDVDLAGEFLVMAATLLEVKSQMLVPRPAEETPADGQPPTENNPLDPRFELVQQLLAYKRFKDAAHELDARRHEWESRFARVPGRTPGTSSFSGSSEAALSSASDDDESTAAPIEIDLEDVHVLDLCAAFARILETIGQNKSHQVTYDDTPIALHAEDILDRLTRDASGPNKSMTLQEIFVGRKTRGEMIGLFLAVLELVRQRRVRVLQEKVGVPGDIRLELRPIDEQLRPENEKPTDWRDPATGEIQYEWPSEEARLRAERRSRLRAEAIKKRFTGEAVPEEEIIDVDGEDEVAAAASEDDDADDEAEEIENDLPL